MFAKSEASWLLARPFNSLNSHFPSKTDEVWVLKYGNFSAVLICSLYFSHPQTFKTQACSLSKALNLNRREKRTRRRVCSITDLHPQKKRPLRKSHSHWWNFRSFALSWPLPVLAAQGQLGHTALSRTWMSSAKDTALASYMENRVKFWKVEKERYIWIRSQLSILNYIVSMAWLSGMFQVFVINKSYNRLKFANEWIQVHLVDENSGFCGK